jgi:hypothetical protein
MLALSQDDGATQSALLNRCSVRQAQVVDAVEVDDGRGCLLS